MVYLFAQAPYNMLKIAIQITLHSFLIIVFVAVSLFFNRSCCFIYFHNNILERRGFLFGFRKKIHIKNIQKIEKVFLHLDGAYYLLIDGFSNNQERLRKNSAIFIPCTKKGYDFIRVFWEKELQNPEI